jgi:hypothetical protein
MTIGRAAAFPVAVSVRIPGGGSTGWPARTSQADIEWLV